MIVFKKLDITSFKSIFHCCIDFDTMQDSLYSLEGKNNTVTFAQSNGSGKSTVVDALSYALYGTTDGLSIKKADYQNKNTKIKLKLVLDLSIQDVDYTIERTDKDFKLYKQGEDISELTKTDTEKKFQDILNLSKNEFFSFTLLAQGGSGSFLMKTPSEKLSCLKDFLFGEELLSVQTKIDALIKGYKTDIQDLNLTHSNLQGSLNTLKDMVENMKIEPVVFDLSLEEYEQQLEQLEDKLKHITEIENKKQSCELNLQSLKRQMQKVKQDYDRARENICPTCGQHLQDESVQFKLKNEAKTIKEKASEYKLRLDVIVEDLQKLGSVQNIKNELVETRDKIYKIKSQQDNKQDITNVKQDIENKTAQLDRVKAAKESKEYELQQLNALYKYFKTDFIQYVQQAFISEVENYLNVYCHDIFDVDYHLIISNNSLELLIGDNSYSYLSGGERQRADVVLVLAIKYAMSTFTDKYTNLLILDETLSGQDGEAFENCIELLNNLTSSMDDIKVILVSHRDVKYQSNKILIERYKDKTKLTIDEV